MENAMSRMTVRIYLVALIFTCCSTSGVRSMDMCADESETAQTAELTHSDFPDWTDERKCECNITANNNAYIIFNVHFQYQTPRKECTTAEASHILITNEGKYVPLTVCSSETKNASLTLYLQESDTTTVTLHNRQSRKLRFNVNLRADGDVDIECGAVPIAALIPITGDSDDGGGYTDRQIGAIAAGVIMGAIMLTLIIGGLLDTHGKCNCLFPRTEDIYSSRDNFNDGVGDNPAYQVTPQSSVASSVANITAEKSLQPNGKHISFTESPPNGNLKKGFFNKAFGSRPLASFRKYKYSPDGTKPRKNGSFYTETSGTGLECTFGAQDDIPIERYDTPPESLEQNTVLHQAHPISAIPSGIDPNMNKIHEAIQRTSAPPGSQDRPLEVGRPQNHKSGPAVTPTSDIPDHTNPYLPSNAYKSPLDVSRQRPVNNNQPGKSLVTRPYVSHPDYPNYGDLAPPFNVSADSIIYMDLDELDDFFLRQKRKPEFGFIPDPDKDYTPMITKLYQPQTLKPGSDIPVETPASFQPINTPVAPSKHSNPFARQPNDSMIDTSPIVHDIMQTPRDRDLQSPGSSQFACPMATPTHRNYDPVSSITSTPSHAGYMTPPQDLVEMRRSSASPHLDNISVGSRAFETDV